MKNLIRKAMCTLLCIGMLTGQQSYASDTEMDENGRLQIQRPHELVSTLSDDEIIDEVPVTASWYRNKGFWRKAAIVATGATVLTTATWMIAKHFYGEEQSTTPSTTIPASPWFPSLACNAYLSNALDGRSSAVSPYLEQLEQGVIFIRIAASVSAKQTVDYCKFYGGDYDQYLEGKNVDLACCSHIGASNHSTSPLRWMLNKIWNCTNLNENGSDVGCIQVVPMNLISASAIQVPTTPESSDFVNVNKCTKYNEYLMQHPIAQEILKDMPCTARYFDFFPFYAMDPIELTDLFPALKQLDLIGLSLRGLSGKPLQSLVNALPAWKHLTSFTMYNGGMGENDIKIFAPALPSSLTALRFETSEIGDAGGMFIATAIRNMTNLTLLSLYGNNLGVNGTIAVADALQGKNLYSFGIGNNHIGNRGMSALVSVLRDMGRLKYVSMYYQPGADSRSLCLNATKVLTERGVEVSC